MPGHLLFVMRGERGRTIQRALLVVKDCGLADLRACSYAVNYMSAVRWLCEMFNALASFVERPNDPLSQRPILTIGLFGF
jgi:hypothetical protein